MGFVLSLISFLIFRYCALVIFFYLYSSLWIQRLFVYPFQSSFTISANLFFKHTLNLLLIVRQVWICFLYVLCLFFDFFLNAFVVVMFCLSWAWKPLESTPAFVIQRKFSIATISIPYLVSLPLKSADRLSGSHESDYQLDKSAQGFPI